MATVRSPNSVAARKTRMAISLRLATRSFFGGRSWSRPCGTEAASSDRRDALINSDCYTRPTRGWQSQFRSFSAPSLLQKPLGGCVGEAETGRRELETNVVFSGPALVNQRLNFVAPMRAKVVTRGGFEELPGPSGGHAQSESRGFARAAKRRQRLTGFNRALTLFELFA